MTPERVFVYDDGRLRAMSRAAFQKTWHGQALVVARSLAFLENIRDRKVLSLAQLHQINAGDIRRGGEGGWTKDDPGVFPDGSWDRHPLQHSRKMRITG